MSHDAVGLDGPNGQQTAWSSLPSITEQAFPPLGATRARPVAQDRWERLVTEVSIAAAAPAVWDALTDGFALGSWLAECQGQWAKTGAEAMLDFEDGEFFWCRTEAVEPVDGDRPGLLRYVWRWVGIGPATAVTWSVRPEGATTEVTVTEEAVNPPSDWRTWNGMGWPGILDQLAGYLRTGTSWRWPWRRMGPYVQAEVPAAPYQAWEALTTGGGLQHWLQTSGGSLAPEDPLTVVMGDASGVVLLSVTRAVGPGEAFPSYLPHVAFELRRPAWDRALGGRLWIEPAALGSSLLQVFHHGWEALGLADPLPERRILTAFWVGAMGRAQQLLAPAGPPAGPHGWS